ncbi:phage tail protein, partial [Proteus mirabilis]|nr:phage tail protein [Proteus mirabilis]HEI8518458.1 phage tail protein [Proteus mirabilis]
MSQSAITLAFERWKASATEAQQPVILDEFVLANVPNLDPSKPIDRNEGLPDAKYIMHRQAVNKTGVVNQNAVAYSVTIGAEIGDFDFNWIGLLNKQSGTVAMIVHAPTQRKIKTQAGQQGNVLTRSFLLEYLGASKETAITTPAEMWQIDFTARLSGIDEMQRLINRDKYGVASFFNNGFLVAKAGNQFYITKGLGYIEGLRAELAENKNITVTNQTTKVWVDVSYQGNITSDWGVHIAITVKPDLKNYTDNAGFAHFVFAVASISVTGVITDLRPKGTLDAQYFEDALKKHEQSRNHPDATTTVKGFTKLNNQVGDSENTALTPYGAKKELENYQPKGNYQPAGNYVTTATFNLEINKKIDKASL